MLNSWLHILEILANKRQQWFTCTLLSDRLHIESTETDIFSEKINVFWFLDKNLCKISLIIKTIGSSYSQESQVPVH
jgi:hypothetical protein